MGSDGEQLAKKIRRLISENDGKQRCLDMFKQKKMDLINALISKKTFKMLNTTKLL